MIYCLHLHTTMINQLWMLLFSVTFYSKSLCEVQIQPAPRNQDVQEGRGAMLQCGLVGDDAGHYHISWLQEAKPVVITDRRTQEGGDLHFRPVDRNLDDGAFQCVATHNSTGDEKVSNPVHLNIKWMSVDGVVLHSPSSVVDITSGVDVVLKCNISGKPKPNEIQWKLNNSPVHDEHNKRLLVRNVTMQMTRNVYSCCSTFFREEKCTGPDQDFILTVRDESSPTIISPPHDQTIRRGSSFKLDCLAISNPPSTITWTKNGNLQTLVNRTKGGVCRLCIYPNGTLEQKSVRAGGTYECTALQVASNKKVSAAAAIDIAYIEKFTTEQTDKYFSEGENFEYQCLKPRGIPDVDVHWERSGVKIGEGRTRVSQSKGILIISQSKKSDAGIYTCVASNLADNKSMNLNLHLSVKPRLGLMKNQQVDEGGQITLTCPVIIAAPPAHVKWYKNGQILAEEPDKLEMVGTNLTILQVNPTDESSYVCVAENKEGEEKSNIAQLVVNESLKFYPELFSRCVAIGENQQVKCEVRGSESPTVRWSRKGSAREPAQNISSMASTLLLTPTKRGDSGVYTCTASDQFSTISRTINLTAIHKPTITVPPNNSTLFKGDNLILHCSTNERKLEVEWLFKQSVYTRESTVRKSRVQVLRNGSLYIPEAVPRDSGIYYCLYRTCNFTTSRLADVIIAEGLATEETDNNPGGEQTTNMIQTIALSVSGGVAYVFVTVALIIYCRGKQKRAKQQCIEEEQQRMLPNGTKGESIEMKPLSKLDEEILKLEYPPENICPVTFIGKGELGNVFLSKAPGIFPDLEDDVLVMVKSLDLKQNDGSGDAVHQTNLDKLRESFNREINILHRTNHDNIVKLLAISCKSSPNNPDYLLTEYLEWGTLKLCLHASKEGRIPNFTKMDKMQICFQIASGLENMKERGLVHGDVATRNIVISSQLNVKISFISLSQDGFENEYYSYHGRVIPLRWMAPEAVFDNQLTSKSDVWSFGVTCWEVFTLGEFPFDHVDSDDELVKELETPNPPRLPALQTSRRISSLISKCCQLLPNDRPDIRPIKRKLQSITCVGAESKQPAVDSRDDLDCDGSEV